MAEIKLKAEAMKVQDEYMVNSGYTRQYEGRGCWSYHKKDQPVYKRTYLMREKVYLFEYPDPKETKAS